MGHHTFWGFCLLACLAGTSMGEGSPKIQGEAKCPKGAIYYRLRCYQPVHMLSTWEEAEVECQQLRRGSHLASFQTAAEERLVSSLIRRSSTAKDAWIGMHAVKTPKKLIWGWSDATTYTPGTPLWDNRAPSTAINSSECIAITNIQVPRNRVRWIQRTCVTPLPFVCKYRASFCGGDEQTASSSLGSI